MPVKVNEYESGPNFTICKDGQTVIVNSSKKVPLAKSIIQWKVSLTEENSAFQIRILQRLENEQFYMIGTNSATARHPLTWNLNKSLRYISHDGGVYTEGTGLKSDYSYGLKGDVITVLLEKSFPCRSLINFFLNETLVYRQWVNIPSGSLYPAVGVNHGPGKFEIRWLGCTTLEDTLSIKLNCVSNWIGFQRFSKTGNVVELTGHDDVERLGFSIQAPRPMDDSNTYFEVELLTRLDPETGPSVGLTPAWTSKFQYPGWKEDSVGYMVDDGSFYNDCGDAASQTGQKSHICKVGDRVGCGVVFHSETPADNVRDKQLVLVYFTKNGHVVYTKVRMQPEGGFYPTVGMYPIGEKAKITYPCSPPPPPAKCKHKLQQWNSLYADFRFDEGIEFSDFDSSRCRKKLRMRSTEDTPRLIQQTEQYPQCYFFRVKIEEIGKQGVVHIGLAPKSIQTQKEQLYQDTGLRSRGTIRISKTKVGMSHDSFTTDTKLGDEIGCYVERIDPNEYWIRLTLNGRNLGWSQAIRTDEEVYPTICFQRGPIQIDVRWPDDQSMQDSKPQFVATNLSDWARSDHFIQKEKTITLKKVGDRDRAYNVIGPTALSATDSFFFEVKSVQPEIEEHVLFPGIGVVNGTCALVNTGAAMLKAENSAMFWCSSGLFVTPKGVMRCQAAVDTFETVACKIAPEGNGYVLQYFRDGETVISHKMKTPIGGLYPVLCFHERSKGKMFEVNIIDLHEKQMHPLDDSVMMSDLDSTDDVPQPLSLENNSESTRQLIPPIFQSDDFTEGVNNVYFSLCIKDVRKIQPVTQAMESNGFALQTSLWSSDNKQRFLNMEMSEVSVVCLSPSSCDDPVQSAEVKYMNFKKLTIVPVVLETIPWPPKGKLRSEASIFERFGDLKIDFSGKLIGPEEIKIIERTVHRANATAQPVALSTHQNHTTENIPEADKIDVISMEDGNTDCQSENFDMESEKLESASKTITPVKAKTVSSNCILV